MTKKHFIALADVIKSHNYHDKGYEFNATQIDILADFCQSANSNFKRDRWINYINGTCGKNGGKVK